MTINATGKILRNYKQDLHWHLLGKILYSKQLLICPIAVYTTDNHAVIPHTCHFLHICQVYVEIWNFSAWPFMTNMSNTREIKYAKVQYSKTIQKISVQNLPKKNTTALPHYGTHTWFLSFLLNGQNFRRKNLHRKTRKLQKRILRQNSVNHDLRGQATKKVCKTTQWV